MKVRSLILYLYALVVPLLLAPVVVVSFFIGHPGPMFVASKGVVRLARFILDAKISLIGLEPGLAKKQFIFMANHQSFVDGPLLYWLIPGPVRVILKQEVFRIPVIGTGMRLMGFIPVDRRGLKGGRRSLDLAGNYMARRGYSYLVFPEGTRSRDGKLQTMKRGGFFLALRSRVPIVPITIEGTHGLLPRGGFFARRATIRVTFHPPVPVEGYSEERLPELIRKVRDSIASSMNPEGRT